MRPGYGSVRPTLFKILRNTELLTEDATRSGRVHQTNSRGGVSAHIAIRMAWLFASYKNRQPR